MLFGETEQIGCIYIYKEIHYKELAYVIMGLASPKTYRVSWPAEDPREPIVQFSSEYEGQKTRRVSHVDQQSPGSEQLAFESEGEKHLISKSKAVRQKNYLTHGKLSLFT